MRKHGRKGGLWNERRGVIEKNVFLCQLTKKSRGVVSGAADSGISAARNAEI